MLLPLLLTTCLAATPASPDSTERCIALAPAESLRVTVDGPAEGRPVVIIPGLISPAYAFRKVLPPLAEAGVRAIVIEPLGVGQSSRPGKADYSHSAQAARIAAVMDSLGVRHAIVMGQAVGTAMALRLTLARPDLVDGLLLVEGGPLESAAVPGVKSALKFSWLIRLFAGRGRIRKELRKGLVASSGDTTWITDSLIDHYTEGPAGDMGAVLRALKGMENAVEPDSLTPRLNEVAVPVKLLLGGAAHSGGPSSGRIRQMERRLPHFSMQVVYGAGLHIQEEQPEVLVQDLLAMVKADGRS
jgi:pimeloyl-ACP methyl ester carboxylesterase